MRITFSFFVRNAALLPLLSRGFVEGQNGPHRIRSNTQHKEALELMGMKNAIGGLPVHGEGDNEFWTHHFLQELSLSTTNPPSKAPSSLPTDASSGSPTDAPSNSPTDAESSLPTAAPSSSPTDAQSSSPTEATTGSLSAAPSSSPSAAPSSSPSAATDPPTAATSSSPTAAPSSSPSAATDPPTAATSSSPTDAPSSSPSAGPSSSPTSVPSSSPSAATDPPSAAPSSSPSSAPSGLPRCPCDISDEERFERAFEVVSTISDPEAISDPTSPQGKCFKWIVDEDPYCACPPPKDPKFYQRYVMCVYYYSLDGGNWNECNAPSNLTDPVEIEQANEDCNITADGGDVFNIPTFQGTDAWLTPVYECYWGGLACANDTECMDRIEFEDDGLGGTLPYELQNLTELRYIIIEEGTTAGTIPSEWATIKLLHILDLNFNALTGPIPIEYYDVEFLLQLDLNDNFLNGTIATEIGQLNLVQFIQLEVNKLTGTIPSELGNAKNLRVFEAFTNMLSGSMPQEVCNNRNIVSYNGSGILERLTVDCDADDEFLVECEVPTCCIDCPN